MSFYYVHDDDDDDDDEEEELSDSFVEYDEGEGGDAAWSEQMSASISASMSASASSSEEDHGNLLACGINYDAQRTRLSEYDADADFERVRRRESNEPSVSTYDADTSPVDDARDADAVQMVYDTTNTVAEFLESPVCASPFAQPITVVINNAGHGGSEAGEEARQRLWRILHQPVGVEISGYQGYLEHGCALCGEPNRECTYTVSIDGEEHLAGSHCVTLARALREFGLLVLQRAPVGELLQGVARVQSAKYNH